MSTRIPVSLIAAATCALLSISPLGAEVGHGELIVTTCLACHSGNPSDDGNASIPNLARGYSGAAIASQLKAFRDGTRPSTVMQRHAKGYSDADIRAIADHFDAMNR